MFFLLLQQLRAGTDDLNSVMDCTYYIVMQITLYSNTV